MSLDIRPKDYHKWHTPLENVVHFFKSTLTALGWHTIEEDGIAMDVGCGPGGTTKNLILPFFSKAQKIIALDVLPDMIKIAQENNADPRIEYVVADISEWSNVEQWEEQIAKVVSIHCFHWVKYPEAGFRNVYRLLKFGGEATFYFTMQATMFDVVHNLQTSSKWGQYLKGYDNRIPDSHRYKYDADHYKKFFVGMGFEIVYCTERDQFDFCPSGEAMKNYCTSLCVLVPYIPQEHLEDFKNDLLQELANTGGCTDTGIPRHKGKILEIIVRKI